LPPQITSGKYNLFAEITYESQEKEASSQGSFEIISGKQGSSSLLGNVISGISGKGNYWIMGILLFVIIIGIVIYVLIKRRKRRYYNQGY
jgi:hypothetical protein